MKYCRANGVRSGPGQGPSLQQQQQQKPQQPQPQIRMSLKHSSATGVKRTRCCCWLCPFRRPHTSPSAYQTGGCGKSRQLSDERTLSEQHQRFVFVRLSSSLTSWCSLPPPNSGGEWADSTFKRFSCIKLSRLLRLRIVRHVENRNQFGLLTLRLQLNSWRCRRTRTIWVVRPGLPTVAFS